MIFRVSEIKHIQTLAVIRKKQIHLEIARSGCWQVSTDPGSGFIMFGSIFLLPPTVTVSSTYRKNEELLETLIEHVMQIWEE